MKINEIVEIERVNGDSEEMQKFSLIGTEQARTKKGAMKKVYPFFAEKDQNLDTYLMSFGTQLVTDLVTDALKRDFQLLFFNRAKEDVEKFMGMLKDPNLSGRTITPEYCMRKAMEFTKEGKHADALIWMQKGMELTSKTIEEETQDEVEEETVG